MAVHTSLIGFLYCYFAITFAFAYLFTCLLGAKVVGVSPAAGVEKDFTIPNHGIVEETNAKWVTVTRIRREKTERGREGHGGNCGRGQGGDYS